MKTRQLGTSGLEVSELGFGCTELSTITQGADSIEAKGGRYPENLDKVIDGKLRRLCDRPDGDFHLDR